MASKSLNLVMIVLGVIAVVALVAYGLIAAEGASGTGPVFWLFASLFVVIIGWDIARHVRALRPPPPGEMERPH